MLLLLALALQDPLGAEDIEARETAAADLLRGGEAALPELRRRMAEAVDPEIRARLRDVVRSLEVEGRRREFGGGKEVDGLRARLVRLENEPRGRPPFRLELMNVGAAARPFVVPQRFNVRRPGWSSRSSGAHGEVEITMIRGQSPRRMGGSYGCGGRPQVTAIWLPPGRMQVVESLGSIDLEPGTYELKVTYYAKLLLGTAEDLVSDVQRFEVPGELQAEEEDPP